MNVILFIGLDVHNDSIATSIAPSESTEGRPGLDRAAGLGSARWKAEHWWCARAPLGPVPIESE